MNDQTNRISKLTIRGFKSIQRLDEFLIHDLNVLIGANGAGKSNFVAYFQFLQNMRKQRLQLSVKRQGGADRILSYGVKNISQIIKTIRLAIPFFDDFVLKPQTLPTEEQQIRLWRKTFSAGDRANDTNACDP